MEFKKASLEDLALLGSWNKEMINGQGNRNPMSAEELEERMKTWLVGGEYVTFLFSNHSIPVAYSLHKENEKDIYLRQFYVSKQFRRQGIGTQAMKILFDTIWPKNKRLLVEVLLTNQRAIEFWKAVGYREYYLGLEILPEER